MYGTPKTSQYVNEIDGMQSDTIAIKGHWVLQAYDANGNLVDEREVDNLITNNGLNILVARAVNGLDGLGDNGIVQNLVMGDCGGPACNAPSPTDTALQNKLGEFVRAFQPTANFGQGSITQTFSVGNPAAQTDFREAGLVTTSGLETLVNRVTFDPITKPASGSINVFVTLTLSRP